MRISSVGGELSIVYDGLLFAVTHRGFTADVITKMSNVRCERCGTYCLVLETTLGRVQCCLNCFTLRFRENEYFLDLDIPPLTRSVLNALAFEDRCIRGYIEKLVYFMNEWLSAISNICFNVFFAEKDSIGYRIFITCNAGIGDERVSVILYSFETQGCKVSNSVEGVLKFIASACSYAISRALKINRRVCIIPILGV